MLLFLFFGEGPKNKKEHLPDYPFRLFIIRTIPSRITGINLLTSIAVRLFQSHEGIRSFPFCPLNRKEKICSLCVLCASAVNTVFQSTINNHQSKGLPTDHFLCLCLCADPPAPWTAGGDKAFNRDSFFTLRAVLFCYYGFVPYRHFQVGP